MTDETTALASLLSGTAVLFALLAVYAFYVGRALWIARHEWSQCAADTKLLYLLVAPLLTFAVDILTVTDRVFWSGSKAPAVQNRRQAGGAPRSAGGGYRTSKPAMRTNG